jgi:hypothetical protein
VILLLSTLAMAAESDLVLDLNITGPLDDAILDEEVSLPYTASIEKTYGKGTYRVDIDAKHVGREVILDVKVIDTKPRTEAKVADLGLELQPESAQDASKTVIAPRGLKKDGAKLQYATFAVDASWRWNSGNWPEEARATPAKAGELVVVWEDTVLYGAPADDAPGARLRPAERHPTVAGYVPLTVVEDQGDWLKVSTAEVTDSCHVVSDSRLGALDLTLFVKRSDLLLVTPSVVTVDYKDGTHHTLQPGVVVMPPQGKLLVGDGELLMKADAGDVLADVTLPTGTLAVSFAPTAPTAPAAMEDQVVASSNRSLGETNAGEVYWLGEGPAYLQGAWELPEDPEAAESLIMEEDFVGDASDRPDVGQAQGIVHGACSVHHFQMLPSRIKPSDYVANEGAFAEDVAPTEVVTATWGLKAGTALNWADGTPAGTATGAVDLSGEPTKTADRKVKCGSVVLDSTPVPLVEGMAYEADADGTFEVCFDSKAAVKL